MRRLISAFFAVGSVLFITACDPENDDDFDGETIDQSTLPVPFGPLFDPANSIIPFPTNLLFSGTADGTLNIPVADETDLADPQVALNSLDGFSTIAPMSAGFSGAIAPASVTGTTVRVFEATIDRMTTAVTGITAELTFGLDFFATVSSTDPDGATLGIVPLRPLKPAQGYVVVLTRGIQNPDGDAAVPDTTYGLARLPEPPALPPETAEALEPLRQLVNAQDAALNAFEAGLADLAALAWSFTTQSIGVVLGGQNGARDLANTDAEITTAIASTTIGSTAVFGGLGAANLHAGTITVPYYLTAPSAENPTAPLSSVWKGPTGFDLTGVIPGTTNVPAKTGNQTIPLLISVPMGAKPGGGWPVVMYQHGITTNRATLIAVADALAGAGFAAVAIDQPLHGLPPGHPVRAATEGALTAATIPLPTERTFDVDYVTQDANSSITAPVPDGTVDTSGRHFINLASLMTSRDNLRQAVADLMAVHSQLGTMDYDGGTQPDFDTANVHFLGWSLGAMFGSVFLALEPNVGEAVLAKPGGGIAKLLDGSPNFGPEIAAGLMAAAGISRGTADYESFLGAAQTLVDSVDPLNYAAPDAGTAGGNGGVTLNGARGIMLFEIIGDGGGNPPDQTIPNNVGTFPTFADAPAGIVPSPTAGTDPLHRQLQLNQVTGTALGMGAGVSGEGQPLLRFNAGYHGSLADPATDPLANATVTSVMQTAMGGFMATDGAGFDVSTVVNFATVVADN